MPGVVADDHVSNAGGAQVGTLSRLSNDARFA